MTNLEITNTAVGSYAPDFELPGIDGQVHHLARYLEKFCLVSVIFICSNCPYTELYINTLKQIQEDFAPRGFTLMGMNSTDTMDKMKVFAQRHELNFPYLWDSTQDVSRSLGANQTTTAFLIDNSGVLRYRGRIDNHPHNPSAVGEDYLTEAITSLLKGEAIKIPETAPVGTPLTWRN
jgi:peroxiredoxin